MTQEALDPEHGLSCLFPSTNSNQDTGVSGDINGPESITPFPMATPPIENPVVTVITKQVLLKIREQIQATIRPAWQAALPKDFGSAEHGKLKADQWRTALEFDIPISLIQLLANSKPSDTINNDVYLQKFVRNTLDLAMALAWGLSRRSSDFHADQYMFYMRNYLSGISDLFPEYTLKPIHHYSLHISDILRLFGPLHGTWAFSTERLIGRLQKFKTNSKIGKCWFLPLVRVSTLTNSQGRWRVQLCTCSVDDPILYNWSARIAVQ